MLGGQDLLRGFLANEDGHGGGCNRTQQLRILRDLGARWIVDFGCRIHVPAFGLRILCGIYVPAF